MERREDRDLEGGGDKGKHVRLPAWNRLSLRSTGTFNQTQNEKLATVPEDAAVDGSYHSAWFMALPYVIRGHVISMLGEFIGTFSFLFFAFSATQIAVQGNYPPHWVPSQSSEQLLYIALAFGFSLAVNAWTFFRVSGGLFNPAVNFALCLVGAMTWTRGALLFIAQLIGALVAAAVVSVLFPGDLAVETTLGYTASTAQGFFIEAFATFELVLVIFMLAAEKHDGRFLAPVGIGLALFIAELSTVAFTGGSLNPVRSFAPAAVNHSFPEYHWIYWLGPLLGAAVAAGVYKLLKVLEYETANPDSVDPALQKHKETILPQRRRNSKLAHRVPTPAVTMLNRKSTDEDEDDSYQDARDWPLTDEIMMARKLTGFGEGLIMTVPQGSSREKRVMPD